MATEQNRIEMQILPRIMTLSGAGIRRILPYSKKRMVGPFIFFDHFPSTEFAPGQGMNVSPHPHIGLSTLSYLLEGEVLHHDSLNCRQVLKPGDVNWMTAGSGIAHSERIPEHLRTQKYHLHLLQFWVALPLEKEEVAPSFTHHAENEIPQVQFDGGSVKVVAGEAFGKKSPVEIYSPLFFLDVVCKKKSIFNFTPEPDHETAFYILSGSFQAGDDIYNEGDFIVLKAGSSLRTECIEEGRFVVLGGKPFAEKRFIYWNFVASSADLIENAKTRWKTGNFPQVPGETDIIPLPAE
ncbi:pirin family protein [Bdellovibrio sp. HCB2-146]|uniref:pirin family protein n=1 Tax=Bdellovibrio sp. HCB2-146 TaxID=3394362 RepID=UPI0039BCCC0B